MKRGLCFLGFVCSLLLKASAVPFDSMDLTAPFDITTWNGSFLLPATDPVNPTRGAIVIENCGSREKDIRVMLFKVIDALDFAITDVKFHVASKHGYLALFKSRSVRDTVRLFLVHMYYMQGLLGLSPTPHVVSRPRFACVDESTNKRYAYLGLDYDPWVMCQSSAVTGTGLHSFYAEGTAYIFLCERFFQLAVQPKVDSCPTVVNEDNRFVGNQTEFHRNYQMYRTIYQLSRFYARRALDAFSTPKEMFDWNDCVFKLNAIESLVNPTSLELYVAMVKEDCEEAPIPALG